MQPAAPTRYRRGIWDAMLKIARFSQPSRMIVRHISRRPVRAAMTVAGLAMAGGLLVCSLFFYDAVELMVDTFFHRAQRQDVTVNLVEPTRPSAIYELRRLPGVIAAEPFRQIAAELTLGARSERAGLFALDSGSDLHRVMDRRLQYLTLPDEGLILSTKMAELLGARRGDLIGVELLEGRRPKVTLPVSLVVETHIGKPVYIQRQLANRLLREDNLVSGAYLLVDAGETDRLYRTLKDTPRVAGVSLQTTNLKTFRDTMAEFMDIMISIYVGFAGLIAFGVAYNAARIALAERGRELASLKVLGFGNGEAAYILLGELAVLTVAALPVACLIGFGLSWFLASMFDTELYRVPLAVEASTNGAAIAVVVAATLLSGAITYRRIGRLDMVAVLKTRE